MATSTRMPTAQDFADFSAAYRRLSPHPEHFDEFLQSLSANQNDSRGWTDDELAAITAPVLVVNGDRDFVTLEHTALIQTLIPGSQIAVLPGTTHMQTTRRADLLLPMLAAFLD
jgi:pimeloyl-ACP methyl ester carboxylesterase